SEIPPGSASLLQLQTLAGRLGFEPRQSAPKALDLPLVDRPVNLCRPPNCFCTFQITAMSAITCDSGDLPDLPLVDRPNKTFVDRQTASGLFRSRRSRAMSAITAISRFRLPSAWRTTGSNTQSV